MVRKQKNSKKQDKKKFNLKKFKYTAADKTEVLSLLLWVLSLFLLDVNANLIGAYGSDTYVNLLFGKTIPATTMFWTGFLGAAFFFTLIATRKLYHPKHKKNRFDVFFTVVGTLGLMIILSGGMLLFWFQNNLEIPFFALTLTRITYYHIGIGIEIFTLLYFAITK